MDIVLNTLMGLAVAAFFKDVILQPYFNSLNRKEEGLIENRISETKNLPRMTAGKARRLLGIKDQ